MFKFIFNILREKGKVEDGFVEVEFETQTKETREEAFEKAVQQVLDEQIKEQIRKKLTHLCYSPEVVEQTEKALVKFKGNLSSTYEEDEVRKEFPKANFYTPMFGFRCIGLKFNENLLVERLAEMYNASLDVKS